MAWEVTDMEYTISPEILRLRESNDPPSDTQSQKLLDFRTRCQTEVSELDDKIAELNAQLAWFIDQRSLRCSQAKVCTSLLSPFRRLPPEILGEIFVQCLPDRQSRAPSRYQAPLLLGQVCSRWRRIALGMSRLWEEFTVHVNYEEPDGDGRTAYKYGNIVKQWVSRVGEKALLDYSCEVELSTETCAEASELISHILVPYSHRFRRLDLRSWDAADFEGFLTLPSDRLPNLESLVLRFNLGGLELERSPTIFESLPRLRKVSLMSLSLLENPVNAFPWAQLTNVIIAGLQPGKWAKIFRQCVALQTGVFVLQETDIFGTNVTESFESATFPSLTSLRIVHCNYSEEDSLSATHKPPKWLLSGLEFPSLTRLDLSLDGGGCGFHVRNLHRPPALTSLSVSNGAISTEDLIVLLCESPTIIELEMKNHEDYLKMFTRLTRDPIHAKSLVYLPSLEKLVVQAGPTTNLPYESFYNMVKSRWLLEAPPLVRKIRHASLLVSKDRIEALVEVQLALQPFEDEGMGLNLKVMPSCHWDMPSRDGFMERW